ncbi:MAG: hypothetical protein QME76_09500 [Bacillota bacterium]|nr:hypothetical protein [Bacillota bacterium]
MAELRTGWMEVYELKPITYYHRSDLHRRAERQIERYAQDVRGGRGTTLLSTFQGRTVTTISVDPHPRGELETRRTYQLETFPQEPGMIYYREVSSESVLHVNPVKEKTTESLDQLNRAFSERASGSPFAPPPLAPVPVPFPVIP